MDTNPWLTYLILLSLLPVVFLSAFPHRAVIRHVENTHAKRTNVYFLFLYIRACGVMAGTPGAFCWGPPRHPRAAEVKDDADHPACRCPFGSERPNSWGAALT